MTSDTDTEIPGPFSRFHQLLLVLQPLSQRLLAERLSSYAACKVGRATQSHCPPSVQESLEIPVEAAEQPLRVSRSLPLVIGTVYLLIHLLLSKAEGW